MKIIKIITLAILGTILLLGLIILIHSLPALFIWLESQFGIIITFGIPIILIWILARYK